MRPISLILWTLLLSSSLAAHGGPTPFLEDVLKEYPNIRDLTLFENEAYFTAQSPLGEVSVIMVSKKVRKKWKKTRIATFSGKHSDLEPFLTTDGKRLYFASNRPRQNSEEEVGDYDLWMVERQNTKSDWSTPINLGPPVNTEHNEFYPSLTEAGKLYFTSDRPDSRGKDDIYFSTPTGNGFSAPTSVSDSINTAGYEFNAFISPSESYLIFSGYNREDGLGSGDLYIAYRDENGEWSKSTNLGKGINSKYMDYCPFVDVQTQTLYFTSRRSEVSFKPGGFTHTDNLLRTLNKASNGQSRLYQSHFNSTK